MRDRSLTAITAPERRFAERAPSEHAIDGKDSFAGWRGPSSADRDLQCRAEVANRPTASAHGKLYCERRPAPRAAEQVVRAAACGDKAVGPLTTKLPEPGEVDGYESYSLGRSHIKIMIIYSFYRLSHAVLA
jgi:hypothetical protein